MAEEPGNRVLVVDDSELILDAVRETLSAAGFDVLTSSNPMLVASDLRNRRPDLLLLDVDMPAITGPQVVEALRRSDCLRGVKVVLYSAASDADRLAQVALECGAIGSIAKSVGGRELVSRLRGYLRRRETPSEQLFALKQAIVITTPVLEATLCPLLVKMGVLASGRGIMGVDRIFREGAADLAVLEVNAFPPGRLEEVLRRVKERGLLAGWGTIVVGSSAYADACLTADSLNKATVKQAIKVALAARAERSPAD